MNKTIYVRDEDVATWEKARELAGDKLSPIISAALRRFVAEQEAASQGFERLELVYNDAESGGLPRHKAFFGRWVFPPTDAAVTKSEGGTKKYFCVVAITAKGSIATLSWSETDARTTFKTFDVYNSFESATSNKEIAWAIRAARKKIGVPIEELDI